MDHINSWCNVVHTKESYVEVFRISFSGIHLRPMFTSIVLIWKIYSGKQRCILDCIFRTASVSWLVVCTTSKTFFKRFLSVVKSRKRVLPRFLTTFMASQPFFWLTLPINSLPNPTIFHTILSHPLLLFSSSTIMVFHRWPFIKTCLFGNFQGLYEWSMGLRGIVFFFPPSSFLLPCLPSNSEATGMSYQPESPV